MLEFSVGTHIHHQPLKAGVVLNGIHALPARTTLMAHPDLVKVAPGPLRVAPYPAGGPEVRAQDLLPPVVNDGYESEEALQDLGDEEMARRLKKLYADMAHQSGGEEGGSPTAKGESVTGAAASTTVTEGPQPQARRQPLRRMRDPVPPHMWPATSGPPTMVVAELFNPIWKAWRMAVTELRGNRRGEVMGSAMNPRPEDAFLKMCSEAFDRFVSVETIKDQFLLQVACEPHLSTKEYICMFDEWLGAAKDRWDQQGQVAEKQPRTPANHAIPADEPTSHGAIFADRPIDRELLLKLHEAMTTMLDITPRRLVRIFNELHAMKPPRSLGEALRATSLQAWQAAALDRATVIPLLVASRCSICDERIGDAPRCPRGCLIPMCRACALYWYRACPAGSARCPGEGCDYLLTIEELRAVGFEEPDLEPWQAARLPKAFENGPTKLLTCASGAHLWKPTAHCPNAVAVCRSSQHPWACPCGAPTRCTQCGDLWHPAVSCEKLRRLRTYWEAFQLRQDATEARLRELQKDEEYKELNCKLCTKCGAVVERRSGCADMVCGQDADDGANKQAGCGERFCWNRAPPYRSPLLHQEEVKAGARAAGQRCKCGEPLHGLSFSCVHCQDWHICFACFSKTRQIHSDFLAHPESHVLQPLRGEAQSSTTAPSKWAYPPPYSETSRYTGSRRRQKSSRSRSQSFGRAPNPTGEENSWSASANSRPWLVDRRPPGQLPKPRPPAAPPPPLVRNDPARRLAMGKDGSRE